MLSSRFYEYGKFLKSLWITTIRLVWGMWQLTRFPQPAVTVFGGARIQRDSPFAALARELTHKLANHGFSIITGGGPGIMEAANEGALEALNACDVHDKDCRKRLVSAGISLVRLNNEKANKYVQANIVMAHFFARKWLLVRYSVGFVVFPGGFGTLDELFEVVTLVQCNRMAKVPIILINRSFWQPIMNWIEEQAIPRGLMAPEDQLIISVVDTADEAFVILHQYCKHRDKSIDYGHDQGDMPN
jgi:uncharacterized protein (TIGR00730 family)